MGVGVRVGRGVSVAVAAAVGDGVALADAVVPVAVIGTTVPVDVGAPEFVTVVVIVGVLVAAVTTILTKTSPPKWFP
jgi:hypothetical protein